MKNSLFTLIAICSIMVTNNRSVQAQSGPNPTPITQWTSGGFEIRNPNGSVLMGTLNTGWCHMYTDRPAFIFNKSVHTMGSFSSYYTNDLYLQTGGTTRMTILNNTGYIGIGKSPNYKLDVAGDINFTGNLLQNGQPFSSGNSLWAKDASNNISYSSGNVGIGTTTVGAKLHIKCPNGENGINVDYTSPNDYGYTVLIKTNRDLTKAFVVQDTRANIDIFRVWGNGVVNAKKIYAEAFEVEPEAFNISWFDYVFNSEYKLASLDKVEEFIKINRHLPDIPSESQVKEKGYNLTEMDGLLLKKIEELTLYIIKQQKDIDALKQELSKNNKM